MLLGFKLFLTGLLGFVVTTVAHAIWYTDVKYKVDQPPTLITLGLLWWVSIVLQIAGLLRVIWAY